MKILLAHQVFSPAAERCYANVAAAAAGIADVRRFCLTLDPPGPRLTWLQLDDLWRRRDPRLLAMYERLRQAADDCDVLLNYNGANLHPELLKYLPTFNVYCCFDDPEASAGLSAPVASAFDAAFYGNIASRFQYERFGPPGRCAFLPIFFDPTLVPPRQQRHQLLAAPRHTPISLVCEYTPWRAARLDALVAAFPQARCFGSGWPAGRLSDSDLVALYRDTRVGWNIHNSTGPVNQRTFMLPAFGVLQICDNKTGLGQLFELGREAIGFDTISQAIDATRYYLAHDDERRRIAAAGLDRFWRDYHPSAVWRRIVRQLQDWGAHRRPAVAAQALPRLTLSHRCLLAVRDTRAALLRQAKGWLRPRTGSPQPPRAQAFNPPVDQRLCLGQRRPLPPTALQAPCLRAADGGERSSRPPAADTLCWALASLLGTARRIGVLGHFADSFTALAGVDPARQFIHLDAQPCFDKLGDLDLVVAVAAANEYHRIAAKLPAISEAVGTVILAVTGNAAAAPWPRACAGLAARYGEHYAYRLPDPDIPWLEPTDRWPPQDHLILEVRQPRAAGALSRTTAPQTARAA